MLGGLGALGELALGEIPPIRDTPTVPAWLEPTATMRRKVAAGVAVALIASGPVGPVPVIAPTIDRYMEPLSEPVRLTKKPGIHASRAPFEFATYRSLVAPEVVTVDKWFKPFVDPKRFKAGLPAPQQLASPAVFRPPLVSFAYYEPLSEPRRFKRGLPVQQQAFFTQAYPQPAPAVFTNWFSPLSEPQRSLRGLKVYLQSTTTMPPRVLPTPVIISMSMAATETNSDRVEIVYIVGGAAVSAKVSIIEGPTAEAASSISES